MKKKTKKSLLPYLFLLLFMLTVLYFVTNMNNKVNVLSYDEFVVSLNEGKIEELSVTPKSNAGVYDLSGKLKNYKENETFFVRVPLSDEVIGKILNTNDSYNFKLITDKHIDEVLKLINSNKPNSYVCLPDNKRAVKNYNNLEITDEVNTDEDYMFEFENVLDINEYHIELINDSDDKSNYIIRIDSNEISLPLYFRNIRQSDKMEVKGLNGSKKIKDIFIDNKISLEKRKRIPILVDSNSNIIWIPGIKKSKYDKSKNEKYDIIIKCIKKGGNYEEKN